MNPQTDSLPTALPFPGAVDRVLGAGDTDASRFIARHATDETPTSARLNLTLAEFEPLVDRVMAKAGLIIQDETCPGDYIECAVFPYGLILMVNEMSQSDFEEHLGEPIGKLTALVADTEPMCSSERDTRRCPMYWSTVPPSEPYFVEESP